MYRCARGVRVRRAAFSRHRSDSVVEREYLVRAVTSPLRRGEGKGEEHGGAQTKRRGIATPSEGGEGGPRVTIGRARRAPGCPPGHIGPRTGWERGLVVPPQLALAPAIKQCTPITNEKVSRCIAPCSSHSPRTYAQTLGRWKWKAENGRGGGWLRVAASFWYRPWQILSSPPHPPVPRVVQRRMASQYQIFSPFVTISPLCALMFLVAHQLLRQWAMRAAFAGRVCMALDFRRSGRAPPCPEMVCWPVGGVRAGQ